MAGSCGIGFSKSVSLPKVTIPACTSLQSALLPFTINPQDTQGASHVYVRGAHIELVNPQPGDSLDWMGQTNVYLLPGDRPQVEILSSGTPLTEVVSLPFVGSGADVAADAREASLVLVEGPGTSPAHDVVITGAIDFWVTF